MSTAQPQPTKTDLTDKLKACWRRHFASGYVALSCLTVGLRSKYMYEFVEALASDGTQKADAWVIARECDAAARAQAEHEHLMRGLGVEA